MKRYIAKKHTYFDSDTEAKLLEEHHNRFKYGWFEGYRYGVKTQAMCRFDEFEIVEFEDYYDTANY